MPYIVGLADKSERSRIIDAGYEIIDNNEVGAFVSDVSDRENCPAFTELTVTTVFVCGNVEDLLDITSLGDSLCPYCGGGVTEEIDRWYTERTGVNEGIIECPCCHSNIVVEATETVKFRLTKYSPPPMITIIVEGGTVQDVSGIPDEFGYQVLDFDNFPCCGGAGCKECSQDEATAWK